MPMTAHFGARFCEQLDPILGTTPASNYCGKQRSAEGTYKSICLAGEHLDVDIATYPFHVAPSDAAKIVAHTSKASLLRDIAFRLENM